MAVPGLFWIELGLGVVLLLLSAKAHGRQIRLERELEGHLEVDFMRENDPWVEALWRKDRRQYWILFAVAAGALGIYAMIAGFLGIPPRFGADPFGSPILGAVLLAAFVWAPSVAFLANGFTSVRRFHVALNREGAGRSRKTKILAERGDWLEAAIRGTYAYWGLVTVLLVAEISLALA